MIVSAGGLTLEPVDHERRTNLLVAVGTVVAVAILGVIAFTAGPDLAAQVLFSDGEQEIDCGEFEFDPVAWRDGEPDGGTDGAEEQAAGSVDPSSLIGLDREEVAAMLGSVPGGQPKRDNWAYSAGWVNDGLGPGDGQMLMLRFGRSGRVTRASLLYPF